jgi:hypothetical protein
LRGALVRIRAKITRFGQGQSAIAGGRKRRAPSEKIVAEIRLT